MQIGAPIMVDTCVIDVIASNIAGIGPQLMVMMTPATAKSGENLTFPSIPAELERRFKTMAAQLREESGDVR